MKSLPVLPQEAASILPAARHVATDNVPLPRELYIESTNRCNELCDQCPRTHLGREEQADITLAQVIAITDQFPVLDRVVLHGLGEPMLNPELPAIVSQPALPGADNSLSTIGYLEFAKDIGDVVAYGILAQYQASSDLSVIVARSNQVENLALAVCQLWKGLG